MKLTKISLVATIALGSFLAFGAMAQTADAPAKKGRGGSAAIIEQLALTDAQKAKIQPILDEEMTKMRELRGKTDLSQEQMREERTKITTATDTKIKDAKILTDEQSKKFTELRAQAGKRGGKNKKQ
jgi:Spy/CpxP family protein refolding chaperone